MATFSITHATRLDGVAIVQTLTPTDIAVGQSVTVAGLGNGFDGSPTIAAIPQYEFLGIDENGDFIYDTDIIIPNQLLFFDAGDDFPRELFNPFGTLTWTISCTWTTISNVIEFLGISPATSNDSQYVSTCVNAANAWAFRRRVEAGYADSPTTSPSADVTLGTTLFAAALYRERGSIDSFQTFEMMPPTAVGSNMGRIHQLLGVNRSQVA